MEQQWEGFVTGGRSLVGDYPPRYQLLLGAEVTMVSAVLVMLLYLVMVCSVMVCSVMCDDE